MRTIKREDFFKIFKNQKYVEQLKKIERKLESKRNEDKNTTEITIYGIIGDSWWEGSVSASDIDEVLRNVTGDIVIHLNSPGGDAFDGIAIYNRLKKHDGKVTIHVDGWACSAASVILMAADEAVMGLGSMVMIHEASSFVWGTKTEMRKEADVLDELEEGIIDIYMTKAKISREDVRAKVDAETWMSAKSAVELGFAERADGVEIEPDEPSVSDVRTSEQRKEILNELKDVLGNSVVQKNSYKKWR